MSKDWVKPAGLDSRIGSPPQIHRQRSAKMNRKPKVSRVCGSSSRWNRRRNHRSITAPSPATTRAETISASQKLPVFAMMVEAR